MKLVNFWFIKTDVLMSMMCVGVISGLIYVGVISLTHQEVFSVFKKGKTVKIK